MKTDASPLFLGIDTSNYTTSLCVVDCNKRVISEERRLLPVGENAVGLRQSDALFHHTKALPELSSELFSKVSKETGKIVAVGCSTRPRDKDGSYMPCFLAGVSYASGVSHCLNAEYYEFSHQAGHIKAAVETCGNSSLFNDRFISFHVSGGTTEILLTQKNDVSYSCDIVGGTNDLNAGQAIDRTGVALGLKFPCGKHMDELSQKSNAVFSKADLKISVKNGFANLSGLENLAKKRIRNGETAEDISRFVFSYIARVLKTSCEQVREIHGKLPVCFAGGVMSNSLIRNELSTLENVSFAIPKYSCDNAFGIACLCADLWRTRDK